MRITEAVEMLKTHNEWRRGGTDRDYMDMASPKELGIAIDIIVEHYDRNLPIADNQ